MSPDREAKISAVAAARWLDLTVVLENVHDPHNIGAVLRSCDAAGVREIFLILSDPRIPRTKLPLGKRSSAGAAQWVDVRVFHSAAEGFGQVKNTYGRLLAACPPPASAELFDLDLKQSCALVFGNEHSGLSEEALGWCDGAFYIPQQGMAGSLNISVACAVTLFEAFRQRRDTSPAGDPAQRRKLLEDYLRR